MAIFPWKIDKQTPSVLLYLHGPDQAKCIRAVDSTHQEVARFSITKDSIIRTLPTQQLVCTMTRSTFSSTTTLKTHGQVIKNKQSWEGMQYGKDITSPFGKLKWRPGRGGQEELIDDRRNLLARGNLPGKLC